MFIYRFSRLIKSKLLWGFLALLMVFAFVVADSCSGLAGQTGGARIGDDPVAPRTMSQAERAIGVMNGELMGALPEHAQAFAMFLRANENQDEEEEGLATRRAVWKLLAARAVGDRHGLAAGTPAAVGAIESWFVGPSGAFAPEFYRAFLARANFADSPRAFEELLADTWLPAQAATLAVFNAVGWVSPMERDFTLSTRFDKTTAYAATLPNTLKDEAIDVSDAELQAWYDAHKDDYQVPERRAIAYVEIPSAPFGDKLDIPELDAMQYYEDHQSEFYGTGTNATVTLPFEEVKDKAIAKERARRAMEEAFVHANESLVPQAATAGLAAAAKPYGETKTATLQNGQAPGFQNGRDVAASVFEMDTEEAQFNAVAGDDRVYLIQLTKIEPAHIAALDEVRDAVLADARRDKREQRLRANGETIRGLLAKELEKGTAFDQAVAACKVDGLTATTAMTFTLGNRAADIDIPHRDTILAAAAQLGVKTLSEPQLTPGDDLVLVYVDKREPGDALLKATSTPRLLQELAFWGALPLAGDWLSWNLDRQPPTRADGVPLFPVAQPDEEEPAE